MNLFLVLSHLLALCLPFLLLLRASPSPSPDPYPALVSLPARQQPITSRTAQPVTPAPDVEHDLLPFVIVSTIDGALHAVDREGGKIKWTLSDGVDPLVGGGSQGNLGEEEYIVEPLNGGLYVFEQDEDAEAGTNPRIRKLPLSVDQLIEISPFTFPNSPERVFTGSKHTSLITLDIRTGQQLDCFSSFSSNSSNCDKHCNCQKDGELDDLEGLSRSDKDILFVGRTDYRLTIHSPQQRSSAGGKANALSPHRGGKKVIQEIVYSTYTANTFDKPLAEYWAKVGATQNMREHDGQDAKRMRVELRHDGWAVGVEEGGGVIWQTNMGNIGIGVFDILLPLTPIAANPILVPQPPPHLPSLFPPPKNPQAAPFDITKIPPSTYVGSVPFTMSLIDPASTDDDNSSYSEHYESSRTAVAKKPLLFALSSSSYPLINFAPPARPGSLANGSFVISQDLPERDQLLPYLIDPPTDVATTTPEEDQLPVVIEPEAVPSRTKGWVRLIIGVVGALFFCGLTLASLHRRRSVKQADSPVDERTPLLPIPEKTVTIIEPDSAAYNSDKVTILSRDGEAEAETSTPKKKSGRRRVRGKKKLKDAVSEKDDDGEGDDDDGFSTSPPTLTPRKEDKPLPELPREMSTVALDNEEDKERLAISDVVIGFGSHGTVVLKGTWGGRPVAVKRLLSDFTRLASQEVKLLQASDDHPNVIRYYCQERRDNFLYIALDLCQASLADLIEGPDKHIELASVLDRKKALSQITAGLKHLHGMKIIHRDIKPQNVLVSQAKDKSLRMLVSDFGLARRLEQDQSSFAPTANNLAGSLGWRAPECIRGQVRLNDVFDRNSSYSSSSSSGSVLDLTAMDDDKENVARGKGHARLTKAVDLFALGCLYFWVLMSGTHPFGEVYDRESNIVKGDAVNMSDLDILGEEGYEAKELIGKLLANDPDDRPDTSDCLIHPFYWTPAKRLSFLCDASDRFEIMILDPPEPTLVLLETNAAGVVGKDWYSRLDKVFTNNLGKYRKYKGNSVRDLLRAMRNKKHHYQDLEPAVKRHLGSLPSGFLHYFTSRYPALFLHVYGVVKESRLRHESMFETYFQE